MNTKEDVKKLYKKALNIIKKINPTYHKYCEKYSLQFGRKKSAFGSCSPYRKIIEIHMYLSKHSSKKSLLNTILHEFAHSIDFEKNGKSSGHGKPWKDIMIELNLKPNRCGSVDMVIPGKYAFVVKHNENQYEYISTKHRKKRYINTGEKLFSTYLVGRKKETIGKCMYLLWDDFIEKYNSGKVELNDKKMIK